MLVVDDALEKLVSIAGTFTSLIRRVLGHDFP